MRLSHLSDQALGTKLEAVIQCENTSTAEVLAHIAEFDARKLYAPAGYASMFAYCVEKLGLSEDAAYKRIRAARAAREFPAIFEAVAEGRLHLCGVSVMASHLTRDNVEELMAAAERKTRRKIERLIAQRFPQPDVPAQVRPLAAQTQLAPGPVDVTSTEYAAGRAAGQLAPGPVGARAKVAPLSAESFELRMTINSRAHDRLRYIQALLGHAVPSGDLAEVHERAYDALIEQLEKQKFAKTSRPGPLRSSVDPRHVPADVKRKVWVRDGGQCTFVGEGGHRCGSQKRLEFDHVDPVALGGEATEDKIRLRCHAHNQYEAEMIFGAGFMATKREAARQAAAERRAEAAEKRAQAAIEKDPDRSIVPWLKGLGVNLQDAREAAANCATMPPETPMEDRIRAALRFLGARRHFGARPVGTAA